MDKLDWSNGTDEEILAKITEDLQTLPGNMSTVILNGSQECAKVKVEGWMSRLNRFGKMG